MHLAISLGRLGTKCGQMWLENVLRDIRSLYLSGIRLYAWGKYPISIYKYKLCICKGLREFFKKVVQIISSRTKKYFKPLYPLLFNLKRDPKLKRYYVSYHSFYFPHIHVEVTERIIHAYLKIIKMKHGVIKNVTS